MSEPVTPERLAVLADYMLEAGWSEEMVERALSALDSHPMMMLVGGNANISDLNLSTGTIIEFASEPPVALPHSPVGYLALLSERDLLKDRVADLEADLAELVAGVNS